LEPSDYNRIYLVFYMYKEPDLTPEITTLIELIRLSY